MSAPGAVELATDAEGADLYPVAFDLQTGFGRCVGVDLSAALAADPATLPVLLHPEERMLCNGMRGARLAEFAGGRVASRLARAGMRDVRATLRGAGGAPTVKGGFSISISISHTRRFAVALATAEPGCTVGVDLEALDEDGGGNRLLAERILSEAERAADLDGEPIHILRRLSLKEAAYKALFPRRGQVPIRDISVLRSSGPGEGYRITTVAGRDEIAAACLDRGGHVLSFARVA